MKKTITLGQEKKGAASGKQLLQDLEGKTEDIAKEVLDMITALENAPGADDFEFDFWMRLINAMKEVHRTLGYLDGVVKFPEYDEY